MKLRPRPMGIQPASLYRPMAATEPFRNCGGYIGDLPDEGVHLPAPISTSAEAEADDGGTRCEVALDGSDRSFRRPIPAAVALGRFPLIVTWDRARPLVCRRERMPIRLRGGPGGISQRRKHARAPAGTA